jgi:hypothetical protein
MLIRRTEAEEFFAQTRRAVLLPGVLVLVAVASVASVIFSLLVA